MTDKYQDLAHNPIGKFLVKQLGLPNPPYLERYKGGPLVKGTVLVGSAANGPVAKAVAAGLKSSKIENTGVYAQGKKYKGLVFDATGIDSAQGLVALQEFFTPVLRQLSGSGRVIVIGTLPDEAGSESATIAQRALEGFTRSVAKEAGNGSTANLVYVAKGTEKTLELTLGFFLSPKSAYVSGQVIRIGATGIKAAPAVKDIEKPLAGKVALVTGASRGLGLADMETLARDGATVIGLDVPPLEDDLKKAAERLGGGYIVGDITSPEAPKLIGDYIKKNHGKVDIVVHNAGITRDKMLRNMKPENWQLVVEISVGAPQRITDHLLDKGLINDGGRIVGIASVAGIAGNRGQTNYASAKAGVIGWIQSLSKRVADKGITANVIAPGFMETEMVKTIPLGIREAGRRMNSMSQGGLPVDVAETITWLASPGSQAVSGNVIGVNGQMLLGASSTRNFEKAPAAVPLLLKAALPALPGVGNLPGVKHTGESAPDLVLTLPNVRTDKGHLGRYNAICAYQPADILPPLYPHFAAFGLHLTLLSDTSFPFAPMGVVHLRNRLVHRRPIGVDEVFDIAVRAHDLRSHPKGRLIDVTTTAEVGGENVWEETMTIFSRGSRGAGDEPTRAPLDGVNAPVGPVEWKLKGNLGRRFAAVSGDRNPIHLYPLTAKAFGFPSNIAHGMWTKSRALAALQNRLPSSYEVDAEFRRPVILPTTVAFGSRTDDGVTTFGVTSVRTPGTHLVGRITPA